MITEIAFNEHVSVRSEPCINGRKLFGFKCLSFSWITLIARYIHYSGDVMMPGCSWGREPNWWRLCDGLEEHSTEKHWALSLVWKVLTYTTYLNKIEDQIHSFIAKVFDYGSGKFQQDNALCHTTWLVWGNSFRNMEKTSQC